MDSRVAMEARITGRRPTAAEVNEAITELRPALLRWALALGARPEDVDDLVQETLLAAHRNRARFDPERGSIESWTAAILVRRRRNQRRSWLRRARTLASFRREGSWRVDSPATVVEARLTLSRLLASLTDRQREVVALYEIAEMSAEEAARALDLTAAGVRSIARDARLRLVEAADASRRKGGSR